MKSKSTISLLLIILFSISCHAQEKKVAPTSSELFNEIAQMDETVFNAFNKQDMPVFKALFTEDLEWFQDNGGLLSYETVFKNFGTMFQNENKLSRTL